MAVFTMIVNVDMSKNPSTVLITVDGPTAKAVVEAPTVGEAVTMVERLVGSFLDDIRRNGALAEQGVMDTSMTNYSWMKPGMKLSHRGAMVTVTGVPKRYMNTYKVLVRNQLGQDVTVMCAQLTVDAKYSEDVNKDEG